MVDCDASASPLSEQRLTTSFIKGSWRILVARCAVFMTASSLSWAAPGATWHHLSEAVASRVGTRCGAGAAVAQAGIKALAQREKADIYFGDAAHNALDHHAGRTWARKERPRLC